MCIYIYMYIIADTSIVYCIVYCKLLCTYINRMEDDLWVPQFYLYMTQLDWEVAEESSGHPSTPWMFTHWLIAESYSESFLHFHGADGAGSMVDYGWCDTYSASSARLLDDQKRISRYEVGARCFLPISDPFQTCFRAGLPSSENGSLQDPASSVQKQQHADSAHSLLASKSISSQFIGINCELTDLEANRLCAESACCCFWTLEAGSCRLPFSELGSPARKQVWKGTSYLLSRFLVV